VASLTLEHIARLHIRLPIAKLAQNIECQAAGAANRRQTPCAIFAGTVAPFDTDTRRCKNRFVGVGLWASVWGRSAISTGRSDKRPWPGVRLTCTPRGSRRRSPGGSTRPRDGRRRPPRRQRPPVCPGHVLRGGERLGLERGRWGSIKAYDHVCLISSQYQHISIFGACRMF